MCLKFLSGPLISYHSLLWWAYGFPRMDVREGKHKNYLKLGGISKIGKSHKKVGLVKFEMQNFALLKQEQKRNH